MTDPTKKSGRSAPDWTGKAAIAGAAIGSAALAAALLYTSRRKAKDHGPKHPEDAPETD